VGVKTKTSLMPVQAHIQTGQKIEVSNTNGKQTYMVTVVWEWGEFTMQRCSLTKTKISRIRFPETITLKIK